MTTESAHLVTERVRCEELSPYPHNPRNGDTDAIMESLRAHGQFRPLVVSEDGVVLAGNHTLFAAMELGWEAIDIVRLPVHSASDTAAKIVLADNRTSDRARYDDAALLGLLRTLDDDLFGTGFDSHDVDVLGALLDKVEVEPMDLGTITSDGPAAYDLTLTIPGLTNADIGAFRAIPAGSDAERLRTLLAGARD